MNTISHLTQIMKRQRRGNLRDTRCSNRHLKFPTVAAGRLGLAVLLAVVSSGYAQLVSIDFKVGDVPVATGDNGGVAFFAGQAGDWNAFNMPGASLSSSTATVTTDPLLNGAGQ